MMRKVDNMMFSSQDQLLEINDGSPWLQRILFDGCRFDFPVMDNLSFVDCEFKGCEFENLQISRCSFDGCAFHTCRRIHDGTLEFYRCTIDGCLIEFTETVSVRFHGSLISSSNLVNDSPLYFPFTFHRCTIEGSDLSELEIGPGDLRNCRVSDCAFGDANEARLTIVPEGSVFGYKRVVDPEDLERIVVARLLIPEEARRSNGLGRKCRAEKALVMGFMDGDGKEIHDLEEAFSMYDFGFRYQAFRMAVPDGFEEDRWRECGKGIHFFLTFEEARNYMC